MYSMMMTHPLSTQCQTENRTRVLQEGVVSILTRKAKAVAWVDRILPLLALLSAHQQAAKEMNDPDFQERSCGKGCGNNLQCLQAR